MLDSDLTGLSYAYEHENNNEYYSKQSLLDFSETSILDETCLVMPRNISKDLVNQP